MSANPNLPAELRPQIAAGGKIAALVPQTLDEAFRLSQAMAASGMVPRGIDKPEQIMVAIMAGAELGLAPFQSLQSFAVVNGRPTLWGDGLIAVVRARGVRVKEWIDGEGDAMVANCLATRPDTGEEIERAFTVADAKKAGLWGKAGPWQQYPKRMLQMRARALALRDGCADMLRGVQVREEVEDFGHARDVTPKPSGLRERLGGPTGEGFTAAHAEREPQTFVEHAVEIADAEFSEADPNVDPPAQDEPVTPDPAPLPDDAFPGDQPSSGFSSAEPFDAIEWATELNRSLDQFDSLAALNAFTDDADNIAKFGAVERASPGIAKSLLAALNGRRKALTSRDGAGAS